MAFQHPVLKLSTWQKSRKPDFILMDIKLDGEMDGIEAARYINEKFGINSLFLTGYFNDQLIKRASEMGALGYILKTDEQTTDSGIRSKSPLNWSY